MFPKITDIAKAAKVSPAAVSLALNNKTGVSSEVRQKIMRIAEDMGYKTGIEKTYPINENIAIRFLKIAKHGHVVNDRHTDFITEYLEGIESEVKRRNYKFELSFFNQMPIEEIVASQKESTVDGFIVLGTELSAHELGSFTEISKPVVFIDTYFPLSAYDCIDMDNVDGVFKAIQHLYTHGHRSIGLIKSGRETRNFKMREFGFREAMEYFSLPVQDNFTLSVDPAFEQAVIDMRKHLKKLKTLPTAFFCMNDIIAHGCTKALREFDYSIPADISVIGFDDLPLSNFSEPPLTSIRVSTRQIGQRALEKLSERIIGSSKRMPENILVAGNLICRDSVRKL
jgi:LacI family transcriptional regulator